MNKNDNYQSEELKKLIQYSKKELLFKFVIIGDFGVGKTSIIKRYAEGIYSNTYKLTIGADFAIKTFDWDDNTKVILQLWDIAGHERFGSLTSVYYRYAVAAAIVFDLTRPETFNSIEKWLVDLRSKVNMPNGQSLPIILLANKGDVTISNLPHHIADYCKQNNILSWFITSAKDDTNIDEAMYFLLSTVVKNYEVDQYDSNDSIALNKTSNKESIRNSCCHR
ncbi:hypothetical protein ILUMI_10343 [Ignelater luminosus]|uniref:Ras-related protein Rab n=1 Tax=Ignelater luminosus TaxID=2038154 RepID=A0A8K0D0L8_IGNLU|nr:hypothetical protein ILUMI_10343 [Ignelater luminosus]